MSSRVLTITAILFGVCLIFSNCSPNFKSTASNGLLSLSPSPSLTAASPPILTVADEFAGLKIENFSSDPKWRAIGNRQNPDGCVATVNDFRWRDSNFARGDAAGEIGGRLQRTRTTAYYGADITGGKRLLNADDRLRFSGRITVKEFTGGGSNVSIGWFNSDFINYPPSNVMGFGFIDSRYPSGYTHAGEYFEWLIIRAANRLFQPMGSQQRKASQPPNNDFELHMLLSEGRHTVEFEYDPQQAGAKGLIQLKVNGKAQSVQLQTPDEFNRGNDFRGIGATFDRFGIYPADVAGPDLTELYIDDIKYSAICKDGHVCERVETFNSDPGWYGHHNVMTDNDCLGVNSQDFGFSNDTNYAGQNFNGRGELGGHITRVEPDGKAIYYAKGLSKTFDSNEKLFARWRLSLVDSGTDSGFALGWFRESTATEHLYNHTDQGAPGKIAPVAKNFVGVIFDYVGSLGGAYTFPAYSLKEHADWMKGNVKIPTAFWSAIDLLDRALLPKIIIDRRASHEYFLKYDPIAPGADGVIELLMLPANGGKAMQAKFPLPAAHKAKMDGFDAFGLIPERSGGKPLVVYIDDLGFSQ